MFNIIPLIITVATKLVSPPPTDNILSVDEDWPFRNKEFDDDDNDVFTFSFVTFNGVICVSHHTLQII